MISRSEKPLFGLVLAVGRSFRMRRHPDADWLVVVCDLPKLDHRSLAHLIYSRVAAFVLGFWRTGFSASAGEIVLGGSA